MGIREQSIEQILAPVRTRAWADALDVSDAGPAMDRDRAAWAGAVFDREEAAQLERRPQKAGPAGRDAANRLRLCIAAPTDPGRVESHPELRILVDGFPLTVAALPCGRGRPPRLVEGLSAAAGPVIAAVVSAHHARPGEFGVVTLKTDTEHAAACTVTLTVTITREDDRVLWRDWRGVEPGRPTPPELSFDARRYDGEIARIVAGMPQAAE